MAAAAAVEGVRVDPTPVVFTGVKVGQVYRTNVTVTNVGKTSKTIRLRRPISKLFKLRVRDPPVGPVAPGLCVSGTLEFTAQLEEELTDLMLLCVDQHDAIEVPILVYPQSCSLLMDSVVDFGCVVASSKLISKRLPLTNQGTAAGTFLVDCSGEPSLRLSPSSGVIEAGATQWLKIELFTDRPKRLDHEALVKLRNGPAVPLNIRAEVVDQGLELYDLKGCALPLVQFGPVYFGTSSVERVVLRNNGPQACDWISLLQKTAAGAEVAADLLLSTDAALLVRLEKCSLATQDASHVLACVPSQGTLGPHSETTLTLCFSPVCRSATKKKCADMATRQDYSLFLLFECVGNKHGFTPHNGGRGVELAVTGTGLPVSVVPHPTQRFTFPTCLKGQRADLLCVLRNPSPLLPATFRLRKTAHFTAQPTAGTIAPGQCQDVVLSFAPRQLGSFHLRQKLDILGLVFPHKRDERTPDITELRLRSIHTITLHLSAACRPETTHPEPRLNPGLTPAVTNPTGTVLHVRSADLARCTGTVRAAVVNAAKTHLHTHSRSKRHSSDEGEEFVAFPNDRAASLRPSSPHKQYRTIFTGVGRHRYVDPDYTFTEEEEGQRQKHRQTYRDFIAQLRHTRLQRTKARHQGQVEDEVDIGIVPAQGMLPPKLHLGDIDLSTAAEIQELCDSHSTLVANSSGPLAKASITGQVSNSQVTEEVNVVPSTSQEVQDCKRALTPWELYQVVIGPLMVDLGEVCVQSVCVQRLELVNQLSVSVWVQLEVNCPELRRTSPVSHVLPSQSRASLPLMFQSDKLGLFHRTVSYTVNQRHPGQVVVRAQVVPVALELSTSHLVLGPGSALLARSEYRSTVTLRNRRNHPADFTWKPVVTDRGILFSIRPAAGTVEAYRELDCEVVWQPSFSSPLEGDFDLCVHEGSTQRLHCVTKVGFSKVQLSERHVTFGSVALNVPSVRTTVLHNTGLNHAYYQVLDVCPLPGMCVSPSEGLVPVGGQAVLNVHFNPDAVIKFDTRVEIALRSMKSIELRLSGSVEPPRVDISMSHFQFHGVHAGSRRMLPFSMVNRSEAAARVTFDLSEYTDFTVHIPQPSLAAEQESGVIVVDLLTHQTVNCSLDFYPTEVAGYDFILPVTVNSVSCPSPSPSPLPASATPLSPCSPASTCPSTCRSGKHIVTPRPRPLHIPMEPCRVQATVLCAPLEMSPSSLKFHVEPLASQSTFTQTVELKAACVDSVCWQSARGQSAHGQSVCWWLGGGREEQMITVRPASGRLEAGQSVCLAVSLRPSAVNTVCDRVTHLPLALYLGEEEGGQRDTSEKTRPPYSPTYRELDVTIFLHLPTLTIVPSPVLLTPTPLDTNTTASLTLLASGYPGGTMVSAEVEEVEVENGRRLKPVSVGFPRGNTIPGPTPAHLQYQKSPPEAAASSLECTLSLCSPVPVSTCTSITFSDHLHNRFQVEVCVTTDNCLLTVWPYMALHRSQQQIILKTAVSHAGAMSSQATMEAVLQHRHSPSPASGLTSSSSSSSFTRPASSPFNHSVSDSVADESVTDFVSHHEKGHTDIDHNKSDLGVPAFPAADSEEGSYYQRVLLAAQRWFSFFGWPNGLHPISIPHTLRRVVSKIQTKASVGRSYRVSQSKDSRSVLDMLHHLTGTHIPGISRTQTFSKDTDQRTNQLLQQHAAMLTFLRAQGASLCHIRPEYLLDLPEFKHWCSLKVKENGNGMDYSSVDYESLSKRSWTDVLLHIYKVLVLRGVSEAVLSAALSQEVVDHVLAVSSQMLASNVYSVWELRLLRWLNVHYQGMRSTVWGNGEVPSARWVVNFDLDLADGLVLAALLAAYCPYLISSHFKRMYTRACSLEQLFHNNIILVHAFTTLALNMDIQPTDLSDPNPVQMLMLCVHLYERLPQYVPLRTITLSGDLHGAFTKQVRLKNPTSKPLRYQAFILGQEAHIFSFPSGSTITIPPKASTELTVQAAGSFLRPMESVLLLTSSCVTGARGATLTFTLKTLITHITPGKSIKCKSPCYQMKPIPLPISNPFNKEVEFRVVLVESKSNPLEPGKGHNRLIEQVSFKASPEAINSDTNCGEETEVQHTYFCDDAEEFFSAVKTVCLKPGQVDILELSYLPFNLGSKYCSVLLVCPQVGDMVYMVKATGELPLPSPLTARPSPNIALSSNTATDPGACEPLLRLRCPAGQVCERVLCVPLVNAAWERALTAWGQCALMTPEERRRRTLTHTLDSSTVRSDVVARRLTKQQAQLMSEGLDYSVEVSLPEHFSLPCSVRIPLGGNAETLLGEDAGCVYVPLRFQAESAGQFRCQVVLRSWRDTRVYLLEALVAGQGGHGHFDLSSPVNQSVTQDIPLRNESSQDWRLKSMVSGEGFSGPPVMFIPAETTSCYPLIFTPSARRVVTGQLLLVNKGDGTEHTFTLRGVGERPLPLAHVVLRCPVGQVTNAELQVPNHSHKNVTFQVVSDLSIVSGSPSLEISPRQSTPYTLAITPRQRGKCTGCVSFIEADDATEAKQDKEGCYEVCFSLELFCEPASAIKVIDLQCPVQSSVAVEIPINNPHREPLVLAVSLVGEGVSGDPSVRVPPRGALTYQAIFTPTRVGRTTGSVLFQSESMEEFWYQLELHGVPPPVTTLPQVHCQLGKWIRQTISLVNPTAERLELSVNNSNPRNYTLEMDATHTVTVAPHSAVQLGVRFSPSTLGEGNHSSRITFTCPQLKEWCFLLSGRGLMPEREEPVSVSSVIGSHGSVIVTFTNPTEQPALVDITLTDEDPSGGPSRQELSGDKGVFWVPLRRTQGVRVAAGASLDVPVVFAPDTMSLQRAWLCLTLEPLRSLDSHATSNMGTDKRSEKSAIAWVYPIRGVPTEAPGQASQLGTLQCDTGRRLEERLDVQLTGCVPGNQAQSGQQASEVLLEDFLCEVRCEDAAWSEEVEGCVSVGVLAAARDPQSGIVTLNLNLIYNPHTPHRCTAVLVVQSVAGGLWKFPLTLVATEPQADDVIRISAVGLGKTSAVGFRLTSTTRSEEGFTATFLPGSGAAFGVTPSSGTLPPLGSTGALITLSFTPTMYSKKHAARLLVQTANMQWTYEVRGITPLVSPPSARSFIGSTSALKPATSQRRNFVARNLRVLALANSSPLKSTDKRKNT